MSTVYEKHMNKTIEATSCFYTKKFSLIKEKYHLILLEEGTFTTKQAEYQAPCMIGLKENITFTITKTRDLKVRVISFHPSFLNRNISYDLINSGLYEEVLDRYGFIPLTFFYEIINDTPNVLALNKFKLRIFQRYYDGFTDSIFNKADILWSCRARLHLNLILELIEQLGSFKANAKPQSATYDPSYWVPLVEEKIKLTFSEKITLKSLADYVDVSVSTLTKYFKQITGTTITNYIIDYRIKCACDILATTDITIKEISIKCGYTQESFFIRQFIKIMGMSPTTYRETVLSRRIQELNGRHISEIPRRT